MASNSSACWRRRLSSTRLFSSPGTTPEKVYLAAVEVDPSEPLQPPPGDGSTMEEGGRIVFIPLSEAIRKCRRGELEDAKAEVALVGLAEKLGYLYTLGMFSHELPAELRERFERGRGEAFPDLS